MPPANCRAAGLKALAAQLAWFPSPYKLYIMCMYVCMYVCVCIYIYTYLYIVLYIYICFYLFVDLMSRTQGLGLRASRLGSGPGNKREGKAEALFVSVPVSILRTCELLR